MPTEVRYMLNSILLHLFPLLMAFAAAFDLLTMRIPNWITLALIGLFAVSVLVIGVPLNQVGLHLAVGFGVLVVAFLLFIPGWIGGGDAKFAAAIGLWMGVQSVGSFLVYSAIAGGVLTVILLLYRWTIPAKILPKVEWLTRLHDKKVGAPYGIALAAGAMFAFAKTPIFAALAAVS